MPFTSLGMHAGMATTYLLPEVAGLAVAREMLLTGRVVTGQKQRASAGEPGVPARGRARRGAADRRGGRRCCTHRDRLTKVACRWRTRELRRGVAVEALAQPVTLATADLQEGLAAQRERRAPRFTGR